MSRLDQDIQEVEQRIAQRRLAVELTARATWRRSVSRVLSPVGLIGAAALGFITVVGVFRKRPKIIERRKIGTRSAGKWGSVLGLLMSGGLALLKAQYGSPLNAAQAVMGQVKAFKARKNRESARPQPRAVAR